MGILDGLLGGGGGGSPLDLYGDLFTPEQKAALQQRELSQGLFRMAEKLGQAAQPSRVPVNTLGALGSALGAFGTGSDITEQALKGMQTAELVRQSQQKRALNAKIAPILQFLTENSIDPNSPLGQRILANAGGGATTSAAPAAPGVPTGGPLASNAPSPPPIGSAPGPLPANMGDIAGPASWAPDGSSSLSPITSFPGFEPLPGGGFRALPYGPSDTPGKQSGLLPPPPGANPQMGQGGGLLAGLPFGLGADGDNPDLSNIRIVPLSGEAAPVARPAPDDRSDAAWEYYKPIIKKYESGNRNIEQQVVGPQGGYNPSVGRVTGPSSAGGYLQMIDPTWRAAAQKAGIDTTQFPRAINAPEGVQDEAGKTLFKEQGLAPWAPYNARLAQAVGWTGPTGGGGGQDTVIPSGRGIPASALQRVADTGGGPLATPPGAGAALATPNGGYIPGLGMTPQGLAALNALTKMGGLGDPFSSLLETYYKSPGYLGEKARTEAQAQKDVGLVMDPQIAAETARQTQQYIQQNQEHLSDLQLRNNLIGQGVYLDPVTKTMKPITNAAEAMAAIDIAKERGKTDAQLVQTTLTFPGETQPREVQMTGAQARAVAEGRPVQVGGLTIPAMTGIQLGKPVPTEEQKAEIQARGAAQTAMYQSGQKALDTSHQAVLNANQRTPYYGSMLTAMEGFKPGATKDMQLTAMQYLRDLNIIKGDSVPQGEALRLAGERLAFLAVPPNQGSWSNVERQLLKSSIAGMAMTPEGLTEAIRMARQLDDYDRKVSQIHRDVADKNGGLPNLLEAQRRVEALGPPLSPQQEAALERLRQPASAPVPTPGAPAAAGAIQTPYGTITPVR